MGTSIRTSIHKIGDGVVQFKDKNGTLMEFAVLDIEIEETTKEWDNIDKSGVLQRKNEITGVMAGTVAGFKVVESDPIPTQIINLFKSIVGKFL